MKRRLGEFTLFALMPVGDFVDLMHWSRARTLRGAFNAWAELVRVELARAR